MELSEAEQFLVWMTRAMSKPGCPDFRITCSPHRVTLVYPASELGRGTHDMVGEDSTLDGAHINLKIAMHMAPPE